MYNVTGYYVAGKHKYTLPESKGKGGWAQETCFSGRYLLFNDCLQVIECPKIAELAVRRKLVNGVSWPFSVVQTT
jgi:hypothetical protein